LKAPPALPLKSQAVTLCLFRQCSPLTSDLQESLCPFTYD
jgi:hypothetical protein